MSYYSVPDSHVRDKVKAVLNLSIYATKNELGHGTSTDTSDLAIFYWFESSNRQTGHLYIG